MKDNVRIIYQLHHRTPVWEKGLYDLHNGVCFVCPHCGNEITAVFEKSDLDYDDLYITVAKTIEEASRLIAENDADLEEGME